MCCARVGYYFTGDGAHRYEGRCYQITGRMDDVINVSGHRLGTAEIEDALVSCISNCYNNCNNLVLCVTYHLKVTFHSSSNRDLLVYFMQFADYYYFSCTG